jgi:hypothetical protein
MHALAAILTVSVARVIASVRCVISYAKIADMKIIGIDTE